MRGAAALVAAAGWFGLTALAINQVKFAGSILGAIWQDLGFFTDLANLLCAVTFTGIALKWAWATRPWAVGQALTAILLVVTVYWTLGQGWMVFGRVGVGDVVAHGVAPALVVLFWLLIWPKGQFRWVNVFQWALFPLVYLTYAVTRGLLTHWYPYSWMNVAKHGMAVLLINALADTTIFMIIGAICVGADRLIARRLTRPATAVAAEPMAG